MAQRAVSTSERLHRPGLRDLRPALLAGASGIVVPEVEHGLAKMLDYVRAIEMNVFHQRATIFTVEDNVFFLARRAATLRHHANRVRLAQRSMRNIPRD